MLLSHRRKDRCVIVGQADGHSGHRLGLLNPETVIVRPKEKGGFELVELERTETQDYIWDLYNRKITNCIDLAGRDDIMIFSDGDPTHGDKHPQGLLDVSRGEQIQIATEVMYPWFRHRNVRGAVYFTGTAAHVALGYLSSGASIAAALQGEYPHLAFRSMHHGRLFVKDKIFDVAHHGPGGGSRKWLEGNVARYYLRDRMMDDSAEGMDPADVYMRAHFHILIREWLAMKLAGQEYESHLTVLPSLTGMNEFGRQATKSDPFIVNGLVAYEIIRDEPVRIHPFAETDDQRVEVRIL